MSNQINLKISLPTDVQQLGPIEGLGDPKKVTAYQLKNWISKSALDDYLKDKLIKKIDSYPANTMMHFYKNILKHINNIHKEREKNDSLHNNKSSSPD